MFKRNFIVLSLTCILVGTQSLLTIGKPITQIEKKTQVAGDTNIVVPERLNFTYASNKARPSVVHIRTYSKMTARDGMTPMGPFEDMLREYYGDRWDKMQSERNKSPKENSKPKEEQEEPIGSGSGVIITEDGFIVTNNHITENADKIEVVLNDKRTYNAKLVGTDPSTDMALIKVEEKGLPAIAYGNSDEVQVGEWVLAVGNPFNLASTVTAGIVSAKGRNINILRDKNNSAIESFIQTDAAVNPGNSGGALVNLKGELIGINTAIASPTGSYAGYSFAVPVNLVKKVIDDLKKYGQAQRGLLGIMIQDITSSLIKEKNLKDYKGVYVAGVNKESAAEKSGIKEGDVVTKINDHPVNSPAELQEIVGVHRPGDKVKVTVRREGKEQDIEAILRNTSGGTELVKFNPNAVELKLGTQLIDLSEEEMKKLKTDGGAKVKNLKSGKLKEAGIKEGFVITSIDKTRILNSKEAKAHLGRVTEGGVLIEGVYPNGERAYYAVAF